MSKCLDCFEMEEDPSFCLSSDMFMIGQIVKLKDLETSARLNGRTGTIQIIANQNGRFKILLESGESFLIKASNFDPIVQHSIPCELPLVGSLLKVTKRDSAEFGRLGLLTQIRNGGLSLQLEMLDDRKSCTVSIDEFEAVQCPPFNDLDDLHDIMNAYFVGMSVVAEIVDHPRSHIALYNMAEGRTVNQMTTITMWLEEGHKARSKSKCKAKADPSEKGTTVCLYLRHPRSSLATRRPFCSGGRSRFTASQLREALASPAGLRSDIITALDAFEESEYSDSDSSEPDPPTAPARAGGAAAGAGGAAGQAVQPAAGLQPAGPAVRRVGAAHADADAAAGDPGEVRHSRPRKTRRRWHRAALRARRPLPTPSLEHAGLWR